MDIEEASKGRSGRGVEIAAVVAFVVLNLAAPFLLGEIYPVTVSPMFCDQPTQYCTYEVFDENGNAVDLELLGLHMVYDGNPVGLGMGIKATPTMHKFGEVPTFEEVERHVREMASKVSAELTDSVKVVQTVVCCEGGCPKAAPREFVVQLEGKQQAQ